MKRIKQRLLSLAMTGALLLGFTLPEAFSASAKSSNESGASETQETTSEKPGTKQTKKKTADTQTEEKSSKTKDKTAEKSKSSEDKADSSKSEKSEKKADSDKSEKSEKNAKSSNKEVSLSLSISKPGGLSASGGTWQVDPDKVSALTLSWKCKGDCDSFEVSVSGGVYSASTEKKSAKIPVSGLPEGKYTATVKAIRDGKAVAKAKLSFQIVASTVDEAPENPEAESSENENADESAIPQAQPGEGIPAEGEDNVAAQPDPGAVEADAVEPAAPEDHPAEAAEGESEETRDVEAQVTSQEQTQEEQSEGQMQDTAEDQPVDETQDAPEEKPEAQAQDVSEEQPVEETKDTAQDQSFVETQDTTEEQQEANQLPEYQDAEPVEETQDASEEPTAEDGQEPAQGESADQPQNASEEPTAEDGQEPAQGESADQPQNASEEPTAEDGQEPAQGESADQPQDASEEPTAEDGQEPAQGESADQPQDASEESPAEDGQEPAQGEFADQPQDASEEPSAEDGQGDTQEPLVDEVLDAPGEQPDPEEYDAFAEVHVEEAKDITIDQPVEEECLDLSEPDIQAPQEDPIDVPAVTEESLPDVTVADPDEPEIELDEPEIQPDAADEALALDEPSAETVLREGESDLIASNAGDDREKTDDKLTLSIMGAEGLSVIDGAIHVDATQASAVNLVWSFGGACDDYTVSVSGGVYDKTTKKSQLKLSVKKLSSGQYTVTVAANKDGKVLSSARLGFIVDTADSEGETAGLAITVASPQGLLITEGVYQVDPAQAEALTLTWQYGGECDAYDVSVSGDVYSGRTEEATATIPLSGLASGAYTVTVVALLDGEAAAQGQLSFNIPSQDEKSEEDPGKDGKQGDQPQGGGQRSGGQKGGAAKGDDGQEVNQGFHVTPGEALIGTHTSGNRDMRLYGAVALTLDAGSAMNVLTLGDTALDIRLSDGGLFTASIEENTLALVPQGNAQAWLLNGYALKTLERSGVTSLRLTLNDMTVEFPTLPGLSGRNYGTLCAAGLTSRDYSYTVSSSGCTVTVAGQSFQLSAEGELV